MLPCQPIKLSNLDKSNMKVKVISNIEDYTINISVKKSNIPNDLSKIVSFNFSNCKSMGTRGFHSIWTFYPTEIKNITYVEANNQRMFAMF